MAPNRGKKKIKKTFVKIDSENLYQSLFLIDICVKYMCILDGPKLPG